jgi:hypothetical protein
MCRLCIKTRPCFKETWASIDFFVQRASWNQSTMNKEGWLLSLFCPPHTPIRIRTPWRQRPGDFRKSSPWPFGSPSSCTTILAKACPVPPLQDLFSYQQSTWLMTGLLIRLPNLSWCHRLHWEHVQWRPWVTNSGRNRTLLFSLVT